MAGVKPVVITVEPDADIRDILAGIIADNNISDDFILVPANCVPCAKISIGELATPLVFLDVQGNKVFSERLPKPSSKEKLVEMLPAQDQTAEEFLKDGKGGSGESGSDTDDGVSAPGMTDGGYQSGNF